MQLASRQTLSTTPLASKMAVAIHRNRMEGELVLDGQMLSHWGTIKEA